MTYHDYKEISFALKRFMGRETLTAAELAEKAGVSVKQIYAWLRGISPLAANRDKLCEIFECTPAHLHARPGDQVSFDRYSADQPTVLKLERELGDRGEVFVVTGLAPFLEIDDDDLLGVVLECIRSGTRFTYLSPFPREEGASTANEEFEDLQERILGCRRPEDDFAASMVRGFVYDPSVFGVPNGSGIFLFMFKADEDGSPNLFQFVACSPIGDEAATSTNARRWLRLPAEEARDAWERLGRAVIPVLDADVESNRIPSRVQQDYRKLFDSDAYLDDYKSLRELIQPELSDQRKVKDRLFKIAQKRARQRNSRDLLRILEVGPGDFEVSHGLLYSQLREKAIEFHVTGVESSNIRGDLQYKDRSNAAFSNTPFEEWSPTGQRFDIILAVHSMYLIDPRNLWKMLFALHPDGCIAILHSPLEGNVFNAISHAVDEVVGSGLDSYSDKVAAANPYRIYAEDLQAWLDSGSSEITRGRLEVTSKVDLDQIFTLEGGLTDAGTKVVDYFRGTQRNAQFLSIEWQRALRRRVHSQVGTGPVVTNKETWFFLRRPQSCTRFLLKR